MGDQVGDQAGYVMGESNARQVNGAKPQAGITFDVTQDERHLRLVAHHPELGLAFELWCYEGGPFGQGSWVKQADGSVGAGASLVRRRMDGCAFLGTLPVQEAQAGNSRPE